MTESLDISPKGKVAGTKTVDGWGNTVHRDIICVYKWRGLRHYACDWYGTSWCKKCKNNQYLTKEPPKKKKEHVYYDSIAPIG